MNRANKVGEWTLLEGHSSSLAFAAMLMASLDGVKNKIKRDHSYLTEGGVVTEDLIETWID